MPEPLTASVLLHVGLHKCASTWLQKTIFSDEVLGFFAPLGGMAAMAVTEFVTVDPLMFDAAQARSRLQEAVSTLHRDGLVTVISHEALSSRPHHGRYYAPIVARRLHEVFPDARLLMVFREQVSMISALHVEHVRNGGMHSLAEFIGTGQEPPGWEALCKLSFFHFDRLLAAYEAEFGKDRVLALPLEMLRYEPEAFLARLFGFVGLPVVPVPSGQRANPTWAPTATEACRLANRLVRRNPLGPRQPASYRLAQRFVRAVDALTPAALASRMEAGRRHRIAARLGAEYAESNRRLAAALDLPLADYGYRLG